MHSLLLEMVVIEAKIQFKSQSTVQSTVQSESRFYTTPERLAACVEKIGVPGDEAICNQIVGNNGIYTHVCIQ